MSPFDVWSRKKIIFFAWKATRKTFSLRSHFIITKSYKTFSHFTRRVEFFDENKENSSGVHFTPLLSSSPFVFPKKNRSIRRRKITWWNSFQHYDFEVGKMENKTSKFNFCLPQSDAMFENLWWAMEWGLKFNCFKKIKWMKILRNKN